MAAKICSENVVVLQVDTVPRDAAEYPPTTD